MKDYGIREWFVFGVGSIAMGFQLYEYIADKLEGNLVEGIVFAVSLFLMFAPKALVDIVKEKISKK